MKYLFLTVAVLLSSLGVYTHWGMLVGAAAYLSARPLLVGLVIAAIAVQLLGHFLRTLRTKIVLDQAAPSSVQFQFGALSTGYLFNTLLPLRLGEVIRALLVARRLRISLLYTFTAVAIERMTDVLLVGVLVIIGTFALGYDAMLRVAVVAAGAMVVAVLFLAILVLLKNENRHLLRAVSWFSQLFNVSISNSLRFKVWSLIFGMQSFMGNQRLVRRYIGYALLSWMCYLISAAILVLALLAVESPLQAVVASVSPYVINLPTFNPLDAESYYQLARILPDTATDAQMLDMYAKVAWIVLALPTAVIGIAALVGYRTARVKASAKTHNDSYLNKLLRHEDISQEFPTFLETYFKGYSLTRVLHKIELTGELSLVKFFKGGSDAITVLALKDGALFVKKIVPVEYADRLRVQYDWLMAHAKKRAIVDVIGEQKTDAYYAIDLSYDPSNIALFEYVHTRSLAQSKKALKDVWQYVFKHIYHLQKESLNPKQRDVYVEERLMKKVKQAVLVNEDLKGVVDAKTVTINGEVYDNFYVIMEKIKQHSQAWADLATYRQSSAIHGDLTIDNILMNTKTDRPVIIDPSDDNQIRGPIIDFARHTQSLIAGYEFLNADDEPIKAVLQGDTVTINYHDHRSARYMQLHEYVSQELAPELLTATERKTVLFHAGLLYGRMLAHRVVINPHNTLKYYAVSVVLLNEFYRQYNEG